MYKIIRGYDWLDLADAINASMADGWLPTGGLVYVPRDPIMELSNPTQRPSPPFWQAMYRPHVAGNPGEMIVENRGREDG